MLCNRRIIDLLFESMDKDFAESIQEEKKFSKIRLDAYRLWQLLEVICKENSDDEDQEQDEESLEKYTTSEKYTHPLVAPSDDQGKKREEVCWFPVGTGLCDRSDRSDQGKAQREQEVLPMAIKACTSSYESTSSSDVDHMCLTAR